MALPSYLRSKFREHFSGSARLYEAPGRVNIIGEHTDYNEGFVMPAAINFSCSVAASPRTDRIVAVYSEQFSELAECDLDNITAATKQWPDYAFGVAWSLQRDGLRLRGANLYISSDVPVGAGLSSSAALEVSVGYALLDLADIGVDRTHLALLCQRAENDFVGARCGIMDQFVASHGQAGHSLLLDCRSLSFEPLPIPNDIKLTICNTMVKHELAGDEYNVRRAECEESVRRLHEVLPGTHSLRDVRIDQLETHRGLLTDTLFRRCRHVLTENARVHEMASALKDHDTKAIRALMAESHRSLRDDFEVSCAELDLMVELASSHHSVYGARMTGGGFGGCTVNLVRSADAPRVREELAAEYFAQTGIRPDIYVCEAAGPVAAINAGESALAEARES